MRFRKLLFCSFYWSLRYQHYMHTVHYNYYNKLCVTLYEKYITLYDFWITLYFRVIVWIRVRVSLFDTFKIYKFLKWWLFSELPHHLQVTHITQIFIYGLNFQAILCFGWVDRTSRSFLSNLAKWKYNFKLMIAVFASKINHRNFKEYSRKFLGT